MEPGPKISSLYTLTEPPRVQKNHIILLHQKNSYLHTHRSDVSRVQWLRKCSYKTVFAKVHLHNFTKQVTVLHGTWVWGVRWGSTQAAPLSDAAWRAGIGRWAPSPCSAGWSPDGSWGSAGWHLDGTSPSPGTAAPCPDNDNDNMFYDNSQGRQS